MKIELLEKAKGCIDGINVTEFEPGHYETGENFPESLALGFIQQGKAKKKHY